MNTFPASAEFTRFQDVVRRHLKLLDAAAPLAPNAALDELGLDSAAALGMMLDLEEAFGVVFPPSMFTEETFATPTALWESLESLRR